MFIAALFTIAKIWKQPKCPSTDEWIKKMWYIYTMEYYSDIEINEIQEIEIDDGKININTADLNRLKDIPGIGDVKANSIIMYREENGGFKTIDELKNVDGIGEKTFEKIKNNIKI